MLEDLGFVLEIIVFDQKIQKLFQLAKKNCRVRAHVKSFGRIEDGETLMSHIMTKVHLI